MNMNTAIISNYWDEHIDKMAKDILKEGYSYIDILYKIQDSINKTTVKSNKDKKLHNASPNTGCPHKSHNFKSLSDKFTNLVVFVPGVPESRAEIKPGHNKKVIDVFKISTGEEISLEEYMIRFIPDTTDSGSCHRQPCKIKFEINPMLSVGTLKRFHWNDINTIDDIISYAR